MNDTQTLIIVLGIIALVAIAGIVAAALRKRGIDIQPYFDKANQAIGNVGAAYELAKPFLTNVPLIFTIGDVLAVIETGVGNAEQLHHLGKLTAGEREAAARKYIDDTLKLAGVDITPEVQAVIDGAIQADVLALGHKTKVAEEVA